MIIKENIQINIPEGAMTVLKLLNAHGYEAYVVGGCVRDSILGKIPGDWDITTNATPTQVKEVFFKTIDTGIEHGTVTVRVLGESYEVTTYRIDGKYSDGRHPDKVEFTPNLKDDLLRRDFTINAMAYSPRDGLVDLYGGIEDLNNKIIRCVGNPVDRFTEDALRMFRAIRFSGVLGFEIEKATLNAISLLKENIKYVSMERVQVELIKLLLSDYPSKWNQAENTGLAEQFLPEYTKYSKAEKEYILDKLLETSRDASLRLSILLSYIKCDEDMIKDKIKEILKRLRFDNNTLKEVSVLVSNRNTPITTNETLIRRQIHQIGKTLYPKYLEFRKVLSSDLEKVDLDKQIKVTEQIFNKNDATCIKELDISGADLLKLGYEQGPSLGDILDNLLDKVLENPSLNKKETLISLINK